MPGPEEMRQAMVEYVRATHEAYANRASVLPAAVRGRMPLFGAPFTVVAAGVQNLHVIATREALPPPAGPEVAVEDRIEAMTWTVRFFDPVVEPRLGLIDEQVGAAGEEVRRVLGLTSHLYHLVVAPGAGLGAHHAGHAGAGLANAHAAAAQDYETLRRLGADRRLVDEMEGAFVASLPRAHALLAASLVPRSEAVVALAAAPDPDPTEVRRAVLGALRTEGA